MSLRPHTLEPVPEETARVAYAAFPKGNQHRRDLGGRSGDLGHSRPPPCIPSRT
jgi:hypothetical protein